MNLWISHSRLVCHFFILLSGVMSMHFPHEKEHCRRLVARASHQNVVRSVWPDGFAGSAATGNSVPARLKILQANDSLG